MQGQTNIKEAKDKDAINQAVIEKREEMNDIYTSIVAKDNGIIEEIKGFKNKLKAEAQQVKDDIKELEELTGDEKEAFNTEIDENLEAALEDIDEALSTYFREQAEYAGSIAIARINAKVVIAAEGNRTLDYIDAKKNISEAEVTALKEDVNAIRGDAFKAADEAKSTVGFNFAISHAKNAFNLMTEKIDAIDRLKKEANEAKEAIEGFKGLDEDEQTASKETIDQELGKAIKSIREADSKTKITNAEKDGSFAIYKKREKVKIDVYRNSALKEFNKLENLGDNKESLEKAIEQAAEDAKNAMNRMLSKSGITSELNSGMKNIDKELKNAQLQDVKNVAKSGMVSKAKDAKEAVDILELLTKEEKTAVNEAIEKAREAADKKIDEATTNSGINNAVENGNLAINLVKNKALGKEDLRTKKASTVGSIEKLKGVDEEERGVARNDVNDALNEALTDVENASNKKEVNTAVDTGKATMKGILDALRAKGNENIEDARANAKEELTAEGDKAKTVVDKLDLADEEKQAVKDAIDQRVSNAIANVRDTEDIIAIEQEKGKGLVTIEQEKAKAEVDALNELTKDERSSAKSAVNKVADDAEKAIDGTESAEDAKIQTNKGISNIGLDVDKAKATDAINKAENAALVEIEALNDLTDDEETEKKQAIKNAANSAREEINGTTDKEAVTPALNTGKTAINNVVVDAKLQDFKNKAKADIENKQTTATNKVENLPDLFDDEETVALDAIDQAVTEANNAIDEADNKAAISDAKDEAYAAIDKAFNKANAQDDMRHHAIIKNQDIDHLKGVDSDEKAEATEKINKILTDALAALEEKDADMNAIVKKAKSDMDEIYDGIVSESDKNIDNAKDNAKADLSTEAKEAIEKINALPKLSEEDKEKAISKIKSTQEEGEQKIDNASSPGEATTIKDETVISIKKIVTDATLENAKIQATKELQEKADGTKTNIDELTEIKASEKEDAKTAIDKALDEALGNVDDARSTINVKTAVSNGNNAMDDIYDKLLQENNTIVEEAKEKQKSDLQKEADEHKEQIDALKHVSQEDKDAAKSNIDTIAKEAEEGIDKANSSKAMTEIKAEAVEAMKDEVTKATLADAKVEADKQLQDHAETVKGNIDALTGVDEEDKEAAKTAIDNALSDTKDNVNGSDTVEKVKEATSTGKSAMDELYNKIQTESNDHIAEAQQKAKDELDRVAKDAKQEIDELTHLSDDEQQTAKDAIDQAVTDGKEAIDKAENPKDITSAKEATLDKIKAEKDAAKLADAKAKANESLQQKADSLNESIDALTGVDEDEKAKAKAGIADALENAKDNVKNASDISTVEDAATAGKDAMQDIFDAIAKEDEENINLAKDGAKQELNDAATDAKDAIDKLSNASDEQKTTAKAAVDEALNAGNTAIDEADSPESITTAKEDALDKMKAAQKKAELQDAQAKSKAEIRTHAKNTQDAVDALTGVSDDAKETAKKAIAEEVTKAETAIDAATSIDAVEQAEKAGKSTIDRIYDKIEVKNEKNIQKAKDAATDQLEDEAANAKKEIDDLENISEDAKDALKKKIDEAVSAGKDAIKDAENPEDITNAKNEAFDAIDKTVDQAKLQNAQNKAEQELEDKAASTKEAINKLSEVDKAAKEEAVAAVDKALENALKDVQEAKNIDAVEKALTDGKAEMDRIYDQIVTDNNTILDHAKDKATEELEKAAEDAKDKIDKLPNLSDDEKKAAKDKIDEAVKEGKEQIEKGESPEDITESKKDTVVSIDKIVDDAKLADEKNAAKAELEQKAQSTKDAIDKLTGVSKEDKQAAKELVDQALADAKEAIEQAKDSEAVQEEVSNGKKAMDGIYNQVVIDNNENITNAKEGATEELEKEAENAKDKIDQLENLTDDEKQAAKDAIDDALETGKKAIENAKSPDAITEAKQESQDQIDTIVDDAILIDAQREANKQLDKDAKNAKSEIDKLDYLTDKAKQAAKDKIDETISTGKDAIKNAKTPEEVTSEKQTALDTIQKTVDQAKLTDAKAKATEELNPKAASTKDAIADLTGVNKQDKQKAQAAIDKALSAANKAVKDAKDIPTVEQATQDGKEEMDKVYNTIAKESEAFIKTEKDKAIEEIEKDAEDAKNAIDDLDNLTDKEKEAAKDAIDDALDKAKDAIENTDSPSDIQSEKDKVKDKIEEIVEDAKLNDEKSSANKELKEKADDIKNKIDTLPSLKEEEKEALKEEVNKVFDQATNDINKSKNSSDIQDVLDKGKSALDDIYDKVNANNKVIVDTIIKELETTAKDAKDKIDQLENLTDDEKQAAKDRIDETLEEAKDAVNKAETSKELDKVQNKATDSINQIVEDATLLDTKLDAKNELEAKADSVKEKIDSLSGLTDEEKAKAKQAIDDILNNVKKTIDEAKDTIAITDALNKGKSNMDDILKNAEENSKTNLAQAKKSAIKDLGNKAEKIKNQINQLKNVTKEDKAQAKSAIDKVLKDTEVAVEKADSLTSLNEAIQAGEDNMNDIYQNVRVTILEAPTATDIYDNELIVEGTGIAGATVIAKVDGIEIARTTVNSKLKANAYSLENNGTFTLVLPKTLQAGTSIELVQVFGELTSESTTMKVLPKHNEDLDLTDDYITKPEAGDTTITGKGEPGANIVITDKDGNVLGEGTVDKNGKFEVELNRPLVEGEEIFIYQYKDGQEGGTLSLTIGSNLEGNGPEEDKASQTIEVEPDKAEEQLPSTATNMYNTLLVGITLFALGLLSLFVVRRRKSNE